MYFGKFQTALREFFYPSKSKIEGLYKTEIDWIFKKTPNNINQHDFKDFGWGYIIFTSSSTNNYITNNYAEPFYIVTEAKKIIRNGTDVSGKVSSQFIEEEYKLFREKFNKVGTKQI